MNSLKVFKADTMFDKRIIDMPEQHAHRRYEIYYLKGGERNYFMEDSVYQLYPGAFALVPEYVLHRTYGGPYERILLSFDYTEVPEELKKAVDKCFVKRTTHTPASCRPYIEAL